MGDGSVNSEDYRQPTEGEKLFKRLNKPVKKVGVVVSAPKTVQPPETFSDALKLIGHETITQEKKSP